MQAEIAWALPRAHFVTVTVGESGLAQQPLPSATSRDTGPAHLHARPPDTGHKGLMHTHTRSTSRLEYVMEICWEDSYGESLYLPYY